MDIVGTDFSVVRKGVKKRSTHPDMEESTAINTANELEISKPMTTRKNVAATFNQNDSCRTMIHTCLNESNTDGRYSGWSMITAAICQTESQKTIIAIVLRLFLYVIEISLRYRAAN